MSFIKANCQEKKEKKKKKKVSTAFVPLARGGQVSPGTSVDFFSTEHFFIFVIYKFYKSRLRFFYKINKLVIKNIYMMLGGGAWTGMLMDPPGFFFKKK